MNSIKSLATLIILVVVGGFLYLKINETDPVLPPEVADQSFEVPQIDLGVDSFAPAGDAFAAGGTYASPAADSVAPAFDPGAANAPAPAWSPPPAAAPPAVVGPSGPNSDAPPANPFDAPASGSSYGGAPNAVPSAGSITPNPAAAPPPGAIGAHQESVIEGRVYDDPPATVPAPVEVAGDPARAAAVSPVMQGSPVSGQIPPASPQRTPQFAPQLPAPTASVWRETVEALLESGEFAQALQILTHYYRDPSLPPAEQQEVDNLLGQLAGTVIYSRQHQLEPPHVVKPGETLATIAASYNVSAELLAKINGIAGPGDVSPGTNLKVFRGPFSAVVDLTNREMLLVLNGRYAGRFPVQIGTDQPRAEGAWVVSGKEYNPEYATTRNAVPGGDPNNPLGDRLLVLVQPGGNAVGPFGIHSSPPNATNDPRGYIRLSAADATDVFDILSVGSTVTVRR